MLERVSLFAHLPPPTLNALAESLTLRKCPKHTLLFMEGDVSGQLFIIESGLVCVYTDDDEGRQLVLNYMGPGEYFGELSLVDNRPRSASVVTVEDTVLHCMSRDAFQSFLKAHPEVNQNLLEALADRVRKLTGNVKDMALLDVYGRVAQTLTRLCGEGLTGRSVRLTHQDIANMVGASREMVSRIMKELVVGGYIEMEQKKVRILRTFPKHW